MANLFATLGAAGDALRAFERAVAVEQNNTNNSSTPGFARQDSVLLSRTFQSGRNLVGGVRAGQNADGRNPFAERDVWGRNSSAGYFNELAAKLAPLQKTFDISGTSGISAAFSKFTQALSGWSTSPESISARQSVIATAGGVAAGFREAAAQMASFRTGVDREIGSAVGEINALSARVRAYNSARLRSAEPDAGADANVFDALESLSELGDINAIRQEDGTFTVLLGGQTPLVIGEEQTTLMTAQDQPANAANPGAPPSMRIRTAGGTDLTGQLSSGRLAGLLRVRNEDLAEIEGDATRPGQLNVLAAAFADRVNQLLASGTDAQVPPKAGAPLFQYSAAGATRTAATLVVAPDFDPRKLAAIDPGPPAVSNGIAAKLAGLLQSNDPANQIQGQSYLSYFSSIATRAGEKAAAASDGKARTSDALAHAKGLRDSISGVSLDEEAVRLVTLQRAYQAAARVVTIVDQLAETAVNLIR